MLQLEERKQATDDRLNHPTSPPSSVSTLSQHPISDLDSVGRPYSRLTDPASLNRPLSTHTDQSTLSQYPISDLGSIHRSRLNDPATLGQRSTAWMEEDMYPTKDNVSNLHGTGG